MSRGGSVGHTLSNGLVKWTQLRGDRELCGSEAEVDKKPRERLMVGGRHHEHEHALQSSLC